MFGCFIFLFRQAVKITTAICLSSDYNKVIALNKFRDISGQEYGWAMKMGQWPMSHSFSCKNQDFDGPFEILTGHLEKNMGPRSLNIHLTEK